MSKFKVGDTVRALGASYGGGFSTGSIYKVSRIDDDVVFVEKDDKESNSNGWNEWNFTLVVSEDERSDNLCITTEVITTTKRKVKDGMLSFGIFSDAIKFSGKDSSGKKLWMMFNCRQGMINARELQDLARQLNEIADVLEEGQ